MSAEAFDEWAKCGLLQRTDRILFALRNPHGLSGDVQRGARILAADLIESQQRDYVSLMKWAESQGLNTVVTN